MHFNVPYNCTRQQSQHSNHEDSVGHSQQHVPNQVLQRSPTEGIHVYLKFQSCHSTISKLPEHGSSKQFNKILVLRNSQKHLSYINDILEAYNSQTNKEKGLAEQNFYSQFKALVYNLNFILHN